MRRFLVLALSVILLLTTVLLAAANPQFQDVTATPAQINLSPVEQQAQEQNSAGPTPTRTPTQEGIALLEAKDFANVRAEPSTDAAQLGQIKAGEKYNVIGRYVSWIQFEFQASPTGKGWVFGDLVTLSGNVDNIPNIDPYAGTAVDSGVSAGTATQSVLTQTPGGVLTATVLARIAVPQGTAEPTDNGTHEILPTFTYPPGLIPIAPAPGATTTVASPDSQSVAPVSNSNNLPPIVPILLLGGVGLLGLALSSLRRS
jgi:Bacterial SH3 domain